MFRTSLSIDSKTSSATPESSELYADVKYAHNIGGDYRRTEFGQLGYRFSW